MFHCFSGLHRSKALSSLKQNDMLCLATPSDSNVSRTAIFHQTEICQQQQHMNCDILQRPLWSSEKYRLLVHFICRCLQVGC